MEMSNSPKNALRTKDATTKENCSLDQKDLQCGLWGWNPSFLQKAASIKVFIIIQGSLGLTSSLILLYVSGIITTLEKRFKLTSTASGVLISSYNFGSSISMLFVSYFGSTRHKPHWLAIFTALSGLSCCAMYLPQLIFGPGNVMLKGNEGFCAGKEEMGENCVMDYEGEIAWVIFCVAYTLIGVGMSCYKTIGSAYFDDSILKKNFGLLYAIIFFIDSVGPAFGYLVSSYVLSFYIDPDSKPDYANDDPRWIGAWYKAWLYIGTFQIVLALAVAFFPRVIGPLENHSISDTSLNNKLSLKDFNETVMRLVKNPILMLKTFNHIFYQLSALALLTFLPKYIETQFSYSGVEASLYAGCIELVSSVLGVLLIGSLITRYKLSARYIVVWNLITSIGFAVGLVALIFIGCNTSDFHEIRDVEDKCNANCGCTLAMLYAPVCSIDEHLTYYSPCYAGCTSYQIMNNTKYFVNCSCINGENIAIDGACSVECDTEFYIFVAIFCTMHVIYTTSHVTNQIFGLRCVDKRDKTMSLAIYQVLVLSMSYVLGPVIFGKILDTSCLIWGEKCGENSNCSSYDVEYMRLLLNTTSIGFMIVAILLDVALWFKVGSLDIYGDNDHKETCGNGNTQDGFVN